MSFAIYFRKISLYWNTLRYLRLIQVTERLRRFVRKPQLDLKLAWNFRRASGYWQPPAKRAQKIQADDRFCFLNEVHSVTTTSDWNHPEWDKLWLYNLHYFDDLTAVDGEQRVDWHRALIQRWIDENPSGKGNGWEPYPISLRIVNWIKWALACNSFNVGWGDSLALQARFLAQNLETHLLGNHLFANAKALCFAGLFFGDDEAEELYLTGRRLVEQELPEQVLADGGNFELSPMYHLIFLEDLLDLVNIHIAYDRALPDGVVERITPMFRWLEAMTHPDGEISFFNDAALGVTPTVQEIRDYGDRLCQLPKLGSAEAVGVVTQLRDSGYTRVTMGKAVALIDRAAVGPDYLPAHAHADTLSFELSLYGHRVVVNSGTSVYGVGTLRQLQRSTAMHSTVVVDDENSSEVWGSFRVARRARVFDVSDDEHHDGVVRLSACHDGYKRLAGKPLHCREWLFEDGVLTILDTVVGKGRHDVVSVLPLHPNVGVQKIADHQADLDVSGRKVVVSVEGDGVLEVMWSEYHPEFGLSIENRKLIFIVKKMLPIEITTRISW